MRGELAQAFFSVKDAAQYLGISPKTLYVWRHRRQGPQVSVWALEVESCIGLSLLTPGFENRNRLTRDQTFP
ncbi:helix-turn-helix domain-containing protein [Streptomyces inhibens]|uniref:helix-turn-helix domain-containing protein n=1 Tax=Streptomyces inhibens TaxID=2293571 RepID=UPI00402ABB07